MENETKPQPFKKFRAGNVTAAVWENEQMKDNQAYKTRSITVERSYKDSLGDWKSSDSFGVSDLPKLRLVLDQTYDYLMTKL